MFDQRLNLTLTSNSRIDSLGTLHDGSCKKASRLSFWIHLMINILSTTLLGASNYTMQCLSSPTRKEIDKAHSQGVWLDIGVPSVRNLWRIAKVRVILWWFLAISSIPLHLFYNSAVFSTIRARMFTASLVSIDFLDGAQFNVTEDVVSPTVSFGGSIPSAEEAINRFQVNKTLFERCVILGFLPLTQPDFEVQRISFEHTLEAPIPVSKPSC